MINLKTSIFGCSLFIDTGHQSVADFTDDAISAMSKEAYGNESSELKSHGRVAMVKKGLL